MADKGFDPEITSPDCEKLRLYDSLRLLNLPVSATFMNLNSDGETIQPCGNSKDVYSLMNAFSIKEIIESHEKYNGGKIYGCEYSENYTVNAVFGGNRNFLKFMTVSILFQNYIFPSLRSSQDSPLKMFGKQEKKGGILKSVKSIFSLKTAVNSADSGILPEVAEMAEKFLKDFTEKIIAVLKYSVNDINSLIPEFDGKFEMAESLIEQTAKKIVGSSDRVHDFMESYKSNFPVIGDSDAEGYFRRILEYTAEKAENFSKGA